MKYLTNCLIANFEKNLFNNNSWIVKRKIIKQIKIIMFLVARHLNNGTWKKKNKNNKRRISKKTTKIAEHEESKFSANKRSIFVSFFNSS